MAATSDVTFKDVRLDIVPKLRCLIDQFMPNFVSMLDIDTGKNLNLLLLTLLSDKQALH